MSVDTDRTRKSLGTLKTVATGRRRTSVKIRGPTGNERTAGGRRNVGIRRRFASFRVPRGTIRTVEIVRVAAGTKYEMKASATRLHGRQRASAA